MSRLQISWARMLLVLMDAAILNISVVLAFMVRCDEAVPPHYWDLVRHTAPWMTLTLIGISFALGLYHRIWEYASLDAAATIFMSVTGTFALVGSVVFLVEEIRYPHSVLVIAWAFTTIAVGVSRFSWRWLRQKLVRRGGSRRKRRAVVYGAHRDGIRIAREATLDPASPYEIVGLLDDNPGLRGMVAGGYRVLGSPEQLGELATRHSIDEVIVPRDPTAAVGAVERIVRTGAAIGLKVRIVPRFLELVNASDTSGRLREIDVSDLIGRQPEWPDLHLPRDYVAGRTILVTGAGGSIGSEICRQLCRYQPGRVVLLGRGENRIHKIYYELQGAFPQIAFEPVICNITSAGALREVLRRFRPEVVFHAAAHKHVFLMECNPVEAAWNNVMGTETLSRLAQDCGVERFVLISTDKATEPTSVMGSTKALCERIVSWHNSQSETKFMAVRFGNVLGSAGSVVPIFQELARAGKPLTVTDPEADRYFMTIEEAAFLVLQAGALGDGGETFVLDMGEPIKIVDIAQRILEMNGRDPSAPHAIQFIGLRTGEKLHETLVSPHEGLIETSVRGVRKVHVNGQAPALTGVEEALGQLVQAIEANDGAAVLAILTAAAGAHLGAGMCLSGVHIATSEGPG